MDTQAISAITALVAVIVGPSVAVYLAQRQIHASVVSSNRQKWIDTLRDQLSEIITSIRIFGLHRSMDSIEQEEFAQRLEKLTLMETKINLLLNPLETDHKAISETIHTAIEKLFLGNERDKRIAVKELSAELISQAQVVLKREWQRVKTGD